MNKLILALFTLLALAAGSIWYMVNAGIIIFSYPALAEYTFQAAQKKNITVHWFTETQKNSEKLDIIWAHSNQQNVATVVATWLACMQEEELIDKRVKLETAVVTANNSEAFVSFSHSLFNKEDTIITKWQLIEALFQTLKPLFPELQTIRFLVKNETYHDEHIDFSVSLPVTNFLQTYQAQPATTQPKKLYTIVLAPYGDKNRTGRTIAREFERTFTREMALDIKHNLEKTGTFRVFITHEIGQASEQEQAATLANRLSADMYIALNCFESKKLLPEVNCYFPLYNPGTDFWQKKTTPLTLTPIDKAYLKNIYYSLARSLQISKNLQTLSEQRMLVNTSYGLPLTQLVGIQTPSMILEYGIQKPGQIEELAYFITRTLLTLFNG